MKYRILSTPHKWSALENIKIFICLTDVLLRGQTFNNYFGILNNIYISNKQLIFNAGNTNQ